VRQQLTWIEADFAALDRPSVHDACAAFASDTVVHAGWAGVAGRERNETRQVQRNLPAAVELTHLAGASGARHFIGLGSQADYGECAGRISEVQPLRPTTLYGAAKVAAAVLTRTVAEQVGMQHSWLRVFSTYGSGADPSWVLSTIGLGRCSVSSRSRVP